MLYAARGAPIILLTANQILSPRVGFPRTKNVGGAYKKVAGCFDGKVDKFGAASLSGWPFIRNDEGVCRVPSGFLHGMHRHVFLGTNSRPTHDRQETE